MKMLVVLRGLPGLFLDNTVMTSELPKTPRAKMMPKITRVITLSMPIPRSGLTDGCSSDPFGSRVNPSLLFPSSVTCSMSSASMHSLLLIVLVPIVLPLCKREQVMKKCRGAQSKKVQWVQVASRTESRVQAAVLCASSRVAAPLCLESSPPPSCSISWRCSGCFLIRPVPYSGLKLISNSPVSYSLELLL